MRIVLIRHGERVKGRGVLDEDTPLSELAKRKAEQLRKELAGLGLKPQYYLTSSHLHAKQMGDLLAEGYDGLPPVQVTCVEALTPPVQRPGNIEQIFAAAVTHGLKLEDLKVIAIVGHEPYLGQLVTRLTATRCRPFARAEVVCLEANSLCDFLRGKGKIEFRYPIVDYQEKELRPKIQSKMAVSTFLAGFTFSALLVLLTSAADLSGLQIAAALFLTLALGLFVSSVYIYDRLSMPEGFWAYGERGKIHALYSGRLEKARDYHGDLYFYMVSTWNLVFTPAVFFGLAGFVTLLLSTGNIVLIGAGSAAVAASLRYYVLIRPKLGVD